MAQKSRTISFADYKKTREAMEKRVKEIVKTIPGDTTLHLEEHPNDWIFSTPETYEIFSGKKVDLELLLLIRAELNKLRAQKERGVMCN